MNDSQYLHARGTVPESLADDAEALLLFEGVKGVQRVDSTFLPPGETPPATGDCRIEFYLPASSNTEQGLLPRIKDQWNAFIARHSLDPIGSALQIEALDSEEWATSWRRFFHPLKIGQRLWISPSWEPAVLQPGDLNIEIDPGMAFGTGSHETTRLILDWLDAQAEAGALPEVLLDVGAGSGVLSLAALRLGAHRIVAIDNDPEAVRVAGENTKRNGIDAEQFNVTLTPVAALDGAYPVVMANILSSILLAMKDDLARLTESGGMLLLSGILEEEADEVVDAFVRTGLSHTHTRLLNGWALLEFSHS